MIGRSDKLSNLVSASVLSADMLNLESEIRKMESSSIDMLHFDVMDGIFVNNITYGIPILEQVRKCTDMVLDVHLMITDPSRYVKRFAEAGADIISFHIESEKDVKGTIDMIRSAGAKPAIAVKPLTPIETVYPYLEDVYMILVMTVEPGFGGQSFIPETMSKVEAVRRMISEKDLDIRVQVDGGINAETAKTAASAGADVLVSGSYLFKAESMEEAAGKLRKA